MVFAKVDVEETLRRQDVDGQTAVPQRDTQAQLALPLQVELVPVNGNFQDALEGSLSDELGIEQADKVLFDSEALNVAALEIHDDSQILSAADGDSKLRVFQLGERFGERIDAHAEALLLETVAQLVEIEDAAVHRAAAAFRRIQPGAEPFEIGGVAAVDLDVEPAGRSQLQRVFGSALDGLGQFFARHLTQREVNGRQVLAIKRVELGVVRGAVLRAVPPAPVAALRREKRFPGFPEGGFGGGVRSSLFASFEGARVSFAGVPE